MRRLTIIFLRCCQPWTAFGLAPQGADNVNAAASTPVHRLAVREVSTPRWVLPRDARPSRWPDGRDRSRGHQHRCRRIVFPGALLHQQRHHDGSIKTNEVLNKTMDDVAASADPCTARSHEPPGGVHSMESHCEALVSMAAELRRQDRVRVHCFADCRDVNPSLVSGYVADLVDFLAKVSAEIGVATPAPPRSRAAIGLWIAITAGARPARLRCHQHHQGVRCRVRSGLRAPGAFYEKRPAR